MERDVIRAELLVLFKTHLMGYTDDSSSPVSKTENGVQAEAVPHKRPLGNVKGDSLLQQQVALINKAIDYDILIPSSLDFKSLATLS
ncbi:hypothetical protein TNCV_2234681 [Trichonephila clavipes]|nr:hypothetical protein TNCV_2234681 [Trichonephila clavipes]